MKELSELIHVDRRSEREEKEKEKKQSEFEKRITSLSNGDTVRVGVIVVRNDSCKRAEAQ